MSLRALRKKDSSPGCTNHNNNLRTPTTLFLKKATTSPRKSATKVAASNPNPRTGKQPLLQLRKLLGRSFHSCPDLRQLGWFSSRGLRDNSLLRSRSEGDVAGVTSSGAPLTAANAKSEVCLQRISSHSYEAQPARSPRSEAEMLGGARSHRDLTQSSYGNQTGGEVVTRGRPARRMSECSLGYSQTSSRSMFASQMTLSSGSAAPPVDPNAVLRVPIIGYEVMEERARFTVYKLRVENPETNDCWLVMRRYTDFVRLNGKLKQAFPNVALILPRKKLFGDNFNAVFLDNRVQGLQIFVNSVMAKEELRKCKLVRDFFCLDEPPSYSESMEECRAIFEAQEETITHLKLQIQSKNDLILGLQQKLREEMNEKEQLKEALK
ncbi:hypothetical protein KR018_003712 [Drosophila ironensis]|nr:hypothetical protein KR018_003712 [Drosophila ironensis]